MAASPRAHFASLASRAALCLAVATFGCAKDDAGAPGTPPASGKSAMTALEEASVAMGADDFAKALSMYDGVVADPKANADEKAAAWQGKVICEGHVNGDAGALAALDKLAASKADLQARQYAKIGNELSDAGKNQAAIRVIELATEKFKGDAKVKALLENLGNGLAAKMKASGDEESLKKLGALGYLGTSSGDKR